MAQRTAERETRMETSVRSLKDLDENLQLIIICHMPPSGQRLLFTKDTHYHHLIKKFRKSICEDMLRNLAAVQQAVPLPKACKHWSVPIVGMKCESLKKMLGEAGCRDMRCSMLMNAIKWMQRCRRIGGDAQRNNESLVAEFEAWQYWEKVTKDRILYSLFLAEVNEKLHDTFRGSFDTTCALDFILGIHMIFFDTDTMGMLKVFPTWHINVHSISSHGKPSRALFLEALKEWINRIRLVCYPLTHVIQR